MTPAAPVQPESGNGHGNGHAQPRPAAASAARTADRELARHRAAAAGAAAGARRSRRRSCAAPFRRRPRRSRPPRPSSTSRPRSCCGCRTAIRPRARSCTRPSSRASASACWRWCAIRAGSSTTTTSGSRGCRRTGTRSSPRTVYLVPFGAGGTYEQEVEVHLHPPRGPEAEARVWDLKVVADSKAHRIVAATAPLALHIQPYIETATTLRPQRKKGRRKADFDVTVANKANAPVLVALDGEDPDGEMSFAFNRPPQEIPAGGVGEDADAGAPAEADLDRPRAGPPARGQDRHRRGGGRARRRRAAGRRGARAGAAGGQEEVVAAASAPAADPGRLRPARVQAAAVPAGRQHGAGRPERADAAVPRAAGAGPADGLVQRVPAGQGQRQAAGPRRPGDAGRAAAADPGRVPPEGVAAVVADPGASRCCSCCCSCCCDRCRRTSSCPRSSARSRRSRPRRS